MQTTQQIQQIVSQILFVVFQSDAINAGAAFAAFYELPLGWQGGAAAPDKPPLAAPGALPRLSRRKANHNSSSVSSEKRLLNVSSGYAFAR